MLSYTHINMQQQKISNKNTFPINLCTVCRAWKLTLVINSAASTKNSPSVNEPVLLMFNSNVFVLDDSEQIEVVYIMPPLKSNCPVSITSFLRTYSLLQWEHGPEFWIGSGLEVIHLSFFIQRWIFLKQDLKTSAWFKIYSADASSLRKEVQNSLILSM